MVPADSFKLIRNATFFKGLPETACRRLAGLCRRRSIDKHALLFREGSVGSAVYLLLGGCIHLVKTRPDGSETVIKAVQPGELFAEVILFEQNHYPVSALTTVASDVLEIPRDGFIRLLDERPFRDAFISMLMARQRYLADRVQIISRGDVRERFFRFLIEQYGERETITPVVSKKEIALAIDTTPESLSRLLRQLESEGLLEREGKTLRFCPGYWRSEKVAIDPLSR